MGLIKHHIIREFDQLIQCPYCNKNIENNRWYSIIDITHHYKETTCDECDKIIRIKTWFGSGHDCFDSGSDFCKLLNSKKREEPLEEKIRTKKKIENIVKIIDLKRKPNPD